VLVVGAAQSGAQIAEELYQSGRKVYLATGGAPRAPRRYRGKDIFEWLEETGFFDRPIEMFTNLPGRVWTAPQVTGRDGGHTLNLHQFYRDGVTLLGHARDFIDGRLILSNDLMENIAKSDQGEKFILKNIDEYIRMTGLDIPDEQLPILTDAYQAPEVTALDFQAAGITVIIWASGFQYDKSLLQIPVLDEYGYPITRRGVSPYPGLYFIGIPFLSKLKSGFIFGVSEDAAYIAEHINTRH
jgi:putative flavoprotein involved in K+ transport